MTAKHQMTAMEFIEYLFGEEDEVRFKRIYAYSKGMGFPTVRAAAAHALMEKVNDSQVGYNTSKMVGAINKLVSAVEELE